MTMPCSTAQEMLTPLLDDELDAAERVAVEAHLATCSLCQDERTHIMEISKSTGELFRELLVQAPPCSLEPRRATESPGRGLSRRRWAFKSALAAAAVLVAALVIVFSPRKDKPLSAAEILHRATRALADRDDAEALVTFETPFFSALSSDPDKKPEAVRFRLVVTRANELLVQPVGERASSQPTSGFDGEVFWSYHPEKNEVEILSQAQLAMRSAKSGSGSTPKLMTEDGRFNPKTLLDFVSWKRFGHLDQDFNWVETRVGLDGRRVFQAKATPRDPDNPSRLLKNTLVTLTLTIDTRKDLVESLHIVYRYFGVDLLACNFDLVAVDQHPPAALFDFENHVPKDAKRVRPDRDPAGEREGKSGR